ncbi:MAG: toll/interleukin-1 receptor domain-containing protein [Natronohydrobacter sp.]|nr:toll/interleukin-1 receptor domain-containing protein [Natronohydrobacter sp.]
MADRVIFLSHIHEESALAILIKRALEEEFSGFVDVFVSSDSESNPTGYNFLRRIENTLVSCIGAIYLISPNSATRSWIHFELGAVWIRNCLHLREGKPEIPALPLCHSGMTPSNLPAPLNNLNSIVGNDPLKLEAAFKSIQKAVGGKGPLKTDFVQLAKSIGEFETENGFGRHAKSLFLALDLTPQDSAYLFNYSKSHPPKSFITIPDLELPAEKHHLIRKLEEGELREFIKTKWKKSLRNGRLDGQEQKYVIVDLSIRTSLILDYLMH